MELIEEFTYHAMLKPPVVVGAGPFGARMFFDVTEGTFEGPRLRGRFVGAGGDWALVGADGFARLDVRGQIETDDGAFVYLSFHGLLEMNEKVVAAMNGGETEFGDQYFRTAPRFETGHPRYAWLNQSVFVGEGRICAGFGVAYRVYRLA